ncbi:hypothetical protein NQ317_014982 [Molorchus minor]|uniref:Transposase n=1 Tax=Molorchus minor TaxID=1323400 RepID=A0ABQ9JCH2_9CUCU|nr:hypothetical protein NQ317_014982 [Molorchus minor]
MKKGTNCKVFCCVPGCSSKGTIDRSLSFHLFPKLGVSRVQYETKLGKQLIDRRIAWLLRTKIEKRVSPYMKICSKHFLESDFHYSGGNIVKRVLKKNAVPSQNLYGDDWGWHPKLKSLSTLKKVQFNNNTKVDNDSPWGFLLAIGWAKLIPVRPNKGEILKSIDFQNNTCPLCHKAFNRKDHVQRHFMELHMQKNNYECKKCSKKFKRKYLMDNHEKNCNGERIHVELHVRIINRLRERVLHQTKRKEENGGPITIAETRKPQGIKKEIRAINISCHAPLLSYRIGIGQESLYTGSDSCKFSIKIFKFKSKADWNCHSRVLRAIEQVSRKGHTIHGGEASLLVGSRILTERHFLTFIPRTTKRSNPTRRCFVCTRNNKRRESRYMCKGCELVFCIVPCFEMYHTELMNTYTKGWQIVTALPDTVGETGDDPTMGKNQPAALFPNQFKFPSRFYYLNL